MCEVHDFNQILCVKSTVLIEIDQKVRKKINKNLIKVTKDKILEKREKSGKKITLDKNLSKKYNEIYKRIYIKYTNRKKIIDNIKKEYAIDVVEPDKIVYLNHEEDNYTYKIKKSSINHWEKYFKKETSFESRFGIDDEDSFKSNFKKSLLGRAYKDKVRQLIIDNYFIKEIYNKASIFLVENALTTSYDAFGNIYIPQKTLLSCNDYCLEGIITHEITHLLEGGVDFNLFFEMEDKKIESLISNFMKRQRNIVSNLVEVSADLDTLYYLPNNRAYRESYLKYFKTILQENKKLSKSMKARIAFIKIFMNDDKNTLLAIKLINNMIESLRLRQFRYNNKDWTTDFIMGIEKIKKHIVFNEQQAIKKSNKYKEYRDGLSEESVITLPTY